MAAVQACVGDFNLPAQGTTGPFTVTGVQDSFGAPFTPKLLIFYGHGDGLFGTFQRTWDLLGVDDGTTHYCQCVGNRWPFPSAGGAPSQATPLTYSIASCDDLFTPHLNVSGWVSGIGLGSFTITLDNNGDDADRPITINYLALGGSTLTAKVTRATNYLTIGPGINHLTGLGFQPTAGIFFLPHGTGAASDNDGSVMMVGWADTALNQVCMGSGLEFGATNPTLAAGVMQTGVTLFVNANSGPTTTDYMSLSSWDADGFTFSRLNSNLTDFLFVALGGPTFEAGTFTEPTTNGSQTVNVASGNTPSFVLLGSIGKATSSSPTSQQRWAVGAYDGTNQRAYWDGSNGGISTGTDIGANWGANAAMLMATPAVSGQASNPTPVGTLTATGFSSSGLTGSWTHTDGTQRQIMYLSTAAPPAPAPGIIEPLGAVIWLRRAPHGVEEGRRAFYRLFELWCDVGDNTALSSTPTVQLRVSNDGSQNWGATQPRSLGVSGASTTRVRWIPVGSGRDRVFEVSSATAAPIGLTDAFVEVSVGTS